MGKSHILPDPPSGTIGHQLQAAAMLLRLLSVSRVPVKHPPDNQKSLDVGDELGPCGGV